MQHVNVTSSAIKSIAHNGEDKMQVTFNTGHTYEFSGVPEDVHAELMSASSIGRHFNNHIMGKYPSRKV